MHSIHAVIVRRPVHAGWFDCWPGLRATVRHGVGMAFLPVAAAEARAIACRNMPSVNNQKVTVRMIGALPNRERRCGCQTRPGRATRSGEAPRSDWRDGRYRRLRVHRRAFVVRGGCAMGVGAHTRTPARLPAGPWGLACTSPSAAATPSSFEAAVTDPICAFFDVVAALDAGPLRRVILDVQTEQSSRPARSSASQRCCTYRPLRAVGARRARHHSGLCAALRPLEPTDPFAHGAYP